jgi:hypothetical protein
MTRSDNILRLQPGAVLVPVAMLATWCRPVPCNLVPFWCRYPAGTMQPGAGNLVPVVAMLKEPMF